MSGLGSVVRSSNHERRRRRRRGRRRRSTVQRAGDKDKDVSELCEIDVSSALKGIGKGAASLVGVSLSSCIS